MASRILCFLAFVVLPSLFHNVIALDLDVGNPDSIKAAALQITKNVLTFYPGQKPGQTPGILPKPYYWWQAGALWGELIEYGSYTGDGQYNNLITQAMLFQTGPNRNYMPENVTKELGNDDQAFWAFAAMSAAELKFPDPPKDKGVSWAGLARAVFNDQVYRWETTTCAGGLRWQIFLLNPGYDYKNTISNGAFFQLAARLARYTGNSTYSDWADKMWDWLASTPNLTPDFQVNDGSDVHLNCTDTNHDQWSYNYGTMIMGSANMYSITKGADQDKWRKRIVGLTNKLFERFFLKTLPNGAPGSENVLVEIQCEVSKTCNFDQASFKAYTMRWLAATTQLAPFMHDIIMPKLRESAKGAAKQCSGGDDHTWCGQNWNSATWDGFKGVGEQMSALSVIQANLIDRAPKPVTAMTGGTPGEDSYGNADKAPPKKITTSERTGAAIITAMMIFGIAGTAWWMVDGD